MESTKNTSKQPSAGDNKSSADDYRIKKTSRFVIVSVLLILFALPITAYLFFASGVHNFVHLPTMTENVGSLEDFQSLEGQPVELRDSITVVSFFGTEPYDRLGYISNLNEKIYKQFHEFDGFHFVSILPESAVDDVAEIKYQLGETTNLEDWSFVTGDEIEIRAFFESLKSDLDLNGNLASDYVFLIDKKGNLRGRSEDDEVGTLYGYNTSSVAALNRRMVDDVRVLLAEYRFALKANRQEKIEGE